MSETAPAGTPATTHPDPRRWTVLGILLFAAFMSILDSSIVTVAVPPLQHDFGASYSTVQWVVAAYILTYALVVITGGRLGDIFGRRRMFLLGVAGFTLASLLCGLAPNSELLILFRVCQAVLGALMIPQVFSVIQVLFAHKERVTAISAFGAVAGLGVVCGPVFGGTLIDLDLFGWGWRWIFLVNVPIGVATVIGAAILLRESTQSEKVRIDPGGIAIVTIGLLLLLYPLVQGRDLGWPAWIYAAMVAGVAVLALFVWYERRVSLAGGSPLVELSMFRGRAFSGGVLLGLLTMTVTASLLFFLTIYFQVGHGFSPMRTGLTLLPLAVGIVVGSQVAGWLTLRIGRHVITLGSALAIVALVVLMTQVDGADTVNPWRLAPTMLVVGLGLSLTPPALGSFAFSIVDIRHAGSASGVLNSVLQLGGAVGIAVLGVVFFGLLGSHASTAVRDAGADPRVALVASGVDAPRADRLATGLSDCVRDGFQETDPTVVPASCQQLAQDRQGLPESAQAVLDGTAVRAQHLNFGFALQRSIWLAMGLLVLCVLAAFLLPARLRIPQPPRPPAGQEAPKDTAAAPSRG